MTQPLIVCIDDDPALLHVVARCLRKQSSFDVRTSTRPGEVLEWIDREPVAVLIADYDMPEMTGAELAARAKRIRPETVRILLTGQTSLQTAIDGINHGEIFRFVRKPFEDSALRDIIREAVARHEELLVLSGYRERRERREALHAALEAEYPGISVVQREHGVVVVTADPWSEMRELGFSSIERGLESEDE